MKTSPNMKRVILEVCKKHHVDLTRPGAHIRLDMDGFDRLCIEAISEKAISVAHYFEMNGDLVPEPDIVFFVTETGDWVPVEITQSMTGWKRVAEFTEDGKRITQYLVLEQAAIARFAELWANNIRQQGWLESGKRHLYKHEWQDDAPPWDLDELVAVGEEELADA